MVGGGKEEMEVVGSLGSWIGGGVDGGGEG